MRATQQEAAKSRKRQRRFRIAPDDLPPIDLFRQDFVQDFVRKRRATLPGLGWQV